MDLHIKTCKLQICYLLSTPNPYSTPQTNNNDMFTHVEYILYTTYITFFKKMRALSEILPGLLLYQNLNAQ